MPLTANVVILHLSLLEGIGPATVTQILARKPRTTELADLYACSSGDLQQIYGLSRDKADKIVAGLADVGTLERELECIARHQIQWCTMLDEQYPFLLQQVHVPPAIVYWRGTLYHNYPKALALVGSRNANEYGKQVVRYLVEALVTNGWHTVSGGALGADSYVHQETLRHGGITTAVLGSGLLKPYPAAHIKLFEQIVERGGALVSSFPVQAPARAGNFPARNRIISGLSKGCIVVQAAEQSGALITAQYALEQGREVFAVPGSVFDPLSKGVHALLQQGAKLVTSLEDIVQELGYEVAVNLNSGAVSLSPEPPILASKEPSASFAHTQDTTSTFDTPSDRIIHKCVTPCSTQELLVETDGDYEQLMSLLFELQLQGAVRQNFAGMWEKVTR